LSPRLTPLRTTERQFGLALGFAALLLLMVALALYNLGNMASTHERLNVVVRTYMGKMELVERLRTTARERIVVLQKLLTADDGIERAELEETFNEYAGTFIVARERLLAMPLNAEEQALIKRQGEYTNVAVPIQKQFIELVHQGRLAQAARLLTESAIPAQDRVLEQLWLLYQTQRQLAAAAMDQADHAYTQARSITIAVTGLLLVLALGIALLVWYYSLRAAHALRAEKERAQVSLHSLADAVLRTNALGEIEYLNPAAEKLTGWTVAEAAGQPLPAVLHLIHDGSRESATALIQRTLGHGEVVSDNSDLLLVTRAQHEYAVELTAAPMRDPDGRIAGAVIVFRNVTELRALGRELAYQATHDPMTGLYNRQEFEHRLQTALDLAREGGPVAALCYMDLDLFKVINDTCGHLAGDELLRQLSNLIRTRVRREDSLARVGGDEFAILLPACTLDDAERIAEKVRTTVHDFRFVWEDKSLAVGVSIGVVPVAADSGDLNDVFRGADVACRIAKEAGRNRLHTFRHNDATVATRQREIDWVQYIQRASDQNLFLLYGQGIWPHRAHTTKPAHCEILLRLRAENGAIVAPAAFLPAAERYHLMPAIDRWVVRQALAQLARQRATPGAYNCFNINLSGQSLCDPEFLSFVLAQLRGSGVAPAQICFEITETAAVANLSHATQLIRTLREAGCRFALDDFGAGLSSFGYLKSMRVDYLKIDGAFVRNIVHDRADSAMVNSINQVAHTLNIETIAEYVETEAIRNTVETIGIDYCQGYALSLPVPLEELLDHPATPPRQRAI
jgi:diguanylate cyclase (GGDEF)-like protein/PAS domain S-box-containing protein